ncbi:MAG: ISL3 family transposase [Aquincola sp.]|nr:ISL3 family transposase [Aquincola sp.]
MYRQILGIESPWQVESVTLSTQEKVVTVVLANPELRGPCPTCGVLCSRHDALKRRWRHLDTCQFATVLEADVARVCCPEHGVHMVRVPWAEPGSGFTALFEALVLDWLHEASLQAVAKLMGVSWKVVDRIQRRAVERGLARRQARLPQRLGVDETSFQKGHQYVTVVLDQQDSTVVHVAQGRTKEALGSFLSTFSLPEREAVQSVAMDMSGPYRACVEEHIPDAESKIAFDRFHVAQHLSQAVDQVRRAEHKAFLQQGASPLKKTRYHWLRSRKNLTAKARAEVEALRRTCLRTARAWAIKELAAKLWHYRSRTAARKAWLSWHAWASRTAVPQTFTRVQERVGYVENIEPAAAVRAR